LLAVTPPSTISGESISCTTDPPGPTVYEPEAAYTIGWKHTAPAGTVHTISATPSVIVVSAAAPRSWRLPPAVHRSIRMYGALPVMSATGTRIR
jgi:hypothetical protein